MLLKLMTPCDLVLLYHQALMSKGINTVLWLQRVLTGIDEQAGCVVKVTRLTTLSSQVCWSAKSL